MKNDINNSVVATGKSTISNAKVKVSEIENDYTHKTNSGITNSIVAEDDSQITNAVINIKKEKRKSFWSGFSIGSILMSVIASAIWYFIQQIMES